jgi:hypothetical protein
MNYRTPSLLVLVAPLCVLLCCGGDSRTDRDTAVTDTTAVSAPPVREPNPEAFAATESAAVAESVAVGEPSGLPADEGIVFRASLPDERLMHVRVGGTPERTVYVFLGAVRPSDSLDTSRRVTIYEYDPAEGLYAIDAYTLMAFESPRTHTDEGVYFEEAVLRNSDNLVLVDDTLLYYRENGYSREDETGGIVHDRTFYAYVLGSRQNPRRITADTFSRHSRRRVHTTRSLLLSPTGAVAAYNLSTTILFHHPDTTGARACLRRFTEGHYSKSVLYDTSKGDFSLLKYFPGPANPEEPCPEGALFGGMHWHPDADILFFDNSGICFACIWAIDLRTKVVRKLVPAHAAMHPCFVREGEGGFLVYVQNNTIRRVRFDSNELSDEHRAGPVLEAFLQRYARHVENHRDSLIVERFLDSLYKEEQLEGMYEGDVRLLFKDLYGYDRAFTEIDRFDIRTDSISFSVSEYRGRRREAGSARALITYEDGTTHRVDVYLVRFEDGHGEYRIDGPRG